MLTGQAQLHIKNEDEKWKIKRNGKILEISDKNWLWILL